MKGRHRITIQNKRVRYDFELRRNLTVLRGDSATGKTTLIDMVQEYTNNGANSSIQFACDKRCYVLDGATWKGQLSEMRDGIVFIDEGNPFVFSNDFAQVIQNTDNYYVIVSREGLPNLPYSAEEIYGIRMSGRYGRLNQCYNEFYRIYGAVEPKGPISPEIVITEDSNAGYEFFHDICSKSGISCVAAGGKSRVLSAAIQAKINAEILIIADGAAFGSEMDRVMKFLNGHPNVHLYIPESFEWIILSSNPLKDSQLQELLESPGEFIASEDYFSWERYFTQLLVERTQGTYLQYTKSRLNPAYLKGTVRDGILQMMERIEFKKK